MGAVVPTPPTLRVKVPPRAEVAWMVMACTSPTAGISVSTRYLPRMVGVNATS